MEFCSLTGYFRETNVLIQHQKPQILSIYKSSQILHNIRDKYLRSSLYYVIYYRALFPCGDDLVCIIDDREDVWQGCGNLVQVKPYHFFRHTGNINAPPGLEKADALRLSELATANESYTIDSQNKDDKNDASEQLNEAKQSLDDPSVKETNHEDEKDEKDEKTEKTENEIKEKKNGKDENTKANTEEDAESNVQSSTTKEDAKADKEVTEETEVTEVTEVVPSVKTDKDSKQAKQENNVIDEDDDDYLLYLEDILRRIHTEFYATLDKENTRKSLRDIIPRVRSQVLKGLYLTFSGLIPTHQKLHQSRAYKVARAFGAEVTQVTNLYLFLKYFIVLL